MSRAGPALRAAGENPAPRAAEPADDEAVSALWRQAMTEHATMVPAWFRPPSTEAPGRARLAALRGDRDAALLVVERDGVVVGFVLVRLWDTPRDPAAVRRRRAQVEELVVEPAHRRRGMGRRLVSAARAWAAERGAAEMVLTVWEGNQGAARFWRAAGFLPLSRTLSLELG